MAGTSGAAVMILEVMGVRLMAPWFGQSQLVWTHVIGVVLASISLGQWLGGRWADVDRGPRPATLLIAAGCVGLALPDIVALLGRSLLPDGLELLEAHPFVNLGSLLVALVGLAVPMVAMGAVTPWLVKLSREASEHPGKVVGRVLGAGTAGSLAGTFGATFALLPWLGSAGAVRVAGAMLLCAAAVLWQRHGGRPRFGALWLIAPLLAWPAARASERPLPGLLASVETAYQWARVVEREDGSRALLLNEGLDSFHSIWQPDELLTGMYYDAFLGPVLGAPRSTDGVQRVLVVGLAAGTMAHQILAIDPTIHVRGVELDAALIGLGQRWFDLPAAVQVDSGVDGRMLVERDATRYGAILVDAYSQQIYLPPHLTTVEFFATLRSRLEPGGFVALNVGGVSLDDPVIAAVCATFSVVFPEATAVRIPGTRNVMVLGCEGTTPPSFEAELTSHGLLPALSWMLDRQRFAATGQIQGRVLHDGNAPVEALAHRSWRGSGGELAAAAPRVPAGPADLTEARTLVLQGRWSAARAVLDSCALVEDVGMAAEAELLLGNLAFERRAAAEAAAHYSTVLAMVPSDSGLGQAAAQNKATVEGMAEHQARLGDRERLLVACLVGMLGLFAVAVLWGLRPPAP